MTTSFAPCRHRLQPRHPLVYHCRSPKLAGLKLVTAEVCAGCPFRDHHLPGEGHPAAGVHPGMPVEDLVGRIEGEPVSWPGGWEDWPVTRLAHLRAAQRFLEQLPSYPEGLYAGRGVVLAGGGVRYFPSLYVTVRALRHVGCRLPIQAWYLGREDEMPPHHAEVLAAFGVECVDADAVRARHPCRILNGWELKVFALLHSPFEEVLLLDADCYPVRDPSGLFDDPGYREAGAVFWPDLPDGPALDWGAFGLTPTGLASVESGQVLVNKRSCWRPLQLAWWYNDHSDYSYLHGYGDKHTFEVAWSRCGRPYHRFRETVGWSGHSFEQAGPDGRTLFVHRCRDKFSFGAAGYLTAQTFEANRFHPGLPLERECFGWLAELARALQSSPGAGPCTPPRSSPCPGPFCPAPLIHVSFYTFPERREVWEGTLARWRATDWGADPAFCVGVSGPEPERLSAAYRMLALAHVQHADYYLFLAADLLFNAHIRANLESWPPLRQRWLWLGSLCNPGLPAESEEIAERWQKSYFRVAPGAFRGPQAVVLSRAALEAVLREWDSPGPYDVKVAASAERHGHAPLVHAPSLVQQLPLAGTGGVLSERALDFDPFFRAPAGTLQHGDDRDTKEGGT